MLSSGRKGREFYASHVTRANPFQAGVRFSAWDIHHGTTKEHCMNLPMLVAALLLALFSNAALALGGLADLAVYDRTAAFYFTSLPDAYASRTGRPDNVGAIGVALFRKKRPEPPLDLAPLSRQAPNEAAAPSKRSEDSLGTGHGRSESAPARYAEFE